MKLTYEETIMGVLKNIEGVIARSPPLADDVAISLAFSK